MSSGVQIGQSKFVSDDRGKRWIYEKMDLDFKCGTCKSVYRTELAVKSHIKRTHCEGIDMDSGVWKNFIVLFYILYYNYL